MIPSFLKLGAVAVMALAPRLSLGAGGHHAVDDAALLDTGQCQVETWFDRELGGGRKLQHVGPACRAGAVELGLGIDSAHSLGVTTTIVSAQLKWIQEIRPGLSAGVALGSAVGDRPPRRFLDTVVVPLSWQATDSLLLHVNIGRDQVDGGTGTVRSGVALEWSPTSLWSFVGERFRDGGRAAWRIGARRELGSSVSVDLSRAQVVHQDPRPWWTLGLTWVFGR